MSFHDEKLATALKEAAADFLQRESNRQSLITVTGIRMLKNNKEAVILVSVLPVDKEEQAVGFLKRQRSDFRAYVKEKVRIGLIPFFDFEIDTGEKNRQRIDELLNEDKKSGIDKGSEDGIE